VSGERLLQSIREHGHQNAHWVKDKKDLPDVLLASSRPGDIVIALGAGDVNQAVFSLRDKLEAQSSSRGGAP
jgi:UDP-N-acetylmuramate--alanine ligase